MVMVLVHGTWGDGALKLETQTPRHAPCARCPWHLPQSSVYADKNEISQADKGTLHLAGVDIYFVYKQKAKAGLCIHSPHRTTTAAFVP
jgi:hypothetical protein